MKRYIKSAIAALLAIVIIISGYLPIVAVGQPSSYDTSYNSGTRDVVCTTLDGTGADAYYTGSNEYDVLSEKSASEIKSALTSLMRTTHTYISSYNDCHYKADRTDCENGDKRVSLIYTSYSATMSQWNGWNREHVWPQSLGGNNTSGGGADLHHIRPSDAVVNSTRGNKKYGNTNGGTAKYGSNPATGYLGGYYNSTYFEPLDNVKGDVARICLYVYVRWGSNWGADSITEVFQSVDVLLEWCALDPVDTWEMGRNEVIEDIQGNRNVFIDYPEYAWLIFDRDVPSNLTTPSGEAAGGNSGSGSGNTGDGTHTHSYTSSVTQPTCTTEGVKTFTCSCGDKYTEKVAATGHSYSGNICTRCGVTIGSGTNPGCTHKNSVIKNKVDANCSTDGYSGDIYCADCDTRLEYGNQIPRNDVHSFGDWEVDQDGKCVKHCVNCDIVISMTMDDLLTTVESDAEKILLLLLLGSGDSLLLDTLAK